MNLWLLITLALTIQQGLSTIAVLARAYQLHYSVWTIHFIWFSVTLLQICIGYALGAFLKKRYKKEKFEKWLEKVTSRAKNYLGFGGDRIVIALVSVVISPFIAALVAPWLELSFLTTLICTFLGDLYWYISTWAYALGAYEILSRAKDGLLILIAIAFVIVLISQLRKQKDSSTMV